MVMQEAFFSSSLISPSESRKKIIKEETRLSPNDIAVPPHDDYLDSLLELHDTRIQETKYSFFDSFFLGGYECSSHRLISGKRLDLLHSTEHDRFVLEDYARLRAAGITACRDGVAWHDIERSPGAFNFDRFVKKLRAAQICGVQVIWDLFHYGWPDEIDIFKPEFVNRFALFGRAFAEILSQEYEGEVLICPINEISFVAWAAGKVAYLNPFCRDREAELKIQLVRAALAIMVEIRNILPHAKFMHCDPILNIVPRSHQQQELERAFAYHDGQYEAWDMLMGHLHPELGGSPEFVNLIGANYYRNNQMFFEGAHIHGTSSLYKPLSSLLKALWERYKRPMFIGETSTEGEERIVWLKYISAQVARSLAQGCEIHGITWYPILDYPGWDDDRHCPVGLWGYADEKGMRPVRGEFLKTIQQLEPVMRTLRYKSLSREM